MDEKKTDEVLETTEEETETAEEVNESAEEVTKTAEEVNESAEEAAEDDTETAEEAAEDDTETAEEDTETAEEPESSEEPAKFVDKHGRTVSEEEINKLARHYRHIGFAIFGGLAALLSIFLIYCVVTGYQEGKIYDPFTGENVVSE